MRPPPAACGAVARRLAPYRVGNYATPEEVAPVVADLTALCERDLLSAREGRCLTDAVGEDELLACPRVLLPELVAKVEARATPPVPVEPRDPTRPPGLPVDPWAPPGTVTTSGACDDYAAAQDAFAACPALPAVTRAMMRQANAAVRQRWRSTPAAQHAALERGCAASAAALVPALTQLGCAP